MTPARFFAALYAAQFFPAERRRMQITSIDPPKTAAEKDWDRNCIALVWFTLDEDLHLQVETDVLPPEWFQEEECQVGLAELMDVADFEQWALENGFAGGQRVLLRFWPPEWSRDYWGEWDVEYQYEIAGFVPVPAEQAAAFWEEWISRDYSGPEALRKCAEAP